MNVSVSIIFPIEHYINGEFENFVRYLEKVHHAFYPISFMKDGQPYIIFSTSITKIRNIIRNCYLEYGNDNFEILIRLNEP